ncbi:MAG: efflux RND transporter periplasmic adaptor subunit [Putridiphycobacter sp.]|nr:efflux RND transporter periplasmic adaptor subunit [Putridiphycobacter sp.]
MKITQNKSLVSASKWFASIFLSSLLISCSSESAPAEAVTDHLTTTNQIVITQSQFEMGEMAFGTLSKQPFSTVIRTTGMIDVPPEKKSTVSAYFGGYVKHIALLEGQKIRKGQTLFTLENPNYIQVQQDFLEAKSQLSFLESDYNRQKALAEDKVNSEKTFLKAESDYQVMLARYASLKMKLQLMNINPLTLTQSNLRSTISVTAPISGYITSVMATTGMFLNPSDIAVTIMNTEHMHVELNVFEHDLAKVKIGQDVVFGVQNSSRIHKATVYLINKAIDPKTRSIKLHCHLSNDNEADQFTPGMYVEAKIYATNDSMMALPLEAVVAADGKHYVLIKTTQTDSEIQLAKREAIVGETNGDYVQVLNADDFSNKDEILIKGAFNLISD